MVLGLFLAGAVARPADSLKWDSVLNRVDADVTSSDLVTVLEKISAATGWQVFLEPGTERTVSTTFQNRSPDKALDLLLGDLNRVLLPPTNGVPRLLVFRTTEKEATHRIKGKGDRASRKTGEPIPNELVVTVKPGTNIEELARRLGAKVVGRLGSLDTYRLRFENADSAAAARKSLQNVEDVASVDYNYPVARDLPSLMSGDFFPLNLVAGAVPDKDRIIVGLVDTSVDAVRSGIKDFVLPGISVVGDSTHPEQQPLHGDSMAQIILRAVATMQEGGDGTQVRILPIDVYGNSGTTTTWDVAVGITEAIPAGVRIINLSLGCEGDAQYLHKVIQLGQQQGILFFAAAGNEPGTTPIYPAAYDEVFAVTASDANGNIASYANHGEFVDLEASGNGMVQFDGLVWRVGGTSVSTADASGLGAAFLQKTGLDLKAVEVLLRERLGVNTGTP
jgi:hypothetical protein